MTCKNCNEIIDGNFCSNCGQSTKIERINLANFLQELSESIFQIDRGFFYTLKKLFIRPGHSIRAYLQGKRKNHFKPITYALFLSTVYFLVSQLTGTPTFIGDFLEGFARADSEAATAIQQIKVITWFADNYAYTVLMLLPVYSLASFITFKKSSYNYLEHFVLNTYITGQQAIIYTIAAVFNLWFEYNDFIVFITLAISFFYAFRVFIQFFSTYSRVTVVLRFVLTYILSLVMTLSILMLIFFIIKWILM